MKSALAFLSVAFLLACSAVPTQPTASPAAGMSKAESRYPASCQDSANNLLMQLQRAKADCDNTGNCQAFCSIGAGGGGGFQPTPPMPPPGPVQIREGRCVGTPDEVMNRIQQEETAVAQLQARVTAFGFERESCARNAFGSVQAQNLMSQCQSSLTCHSQCQLDFMADSVVTSAAIESVASATVGKREGICNLADTASHVNCQNECKRRMLAAQKSVCEQFAGSGSCRSEFVGEPTLWYKDGAFRCQATVRATPEQARVKCEVPIRATIQDEGGIRRGRHEH